MRIRPPSLRRAALAGVAALFMGTGPLVQGCGHRPETELVPSKGKVIRYVAIGDSYTCGEGAKPEESWPAVLTHKLRQFGMNVQLVANPAVTGYTTRDALEREMAAYDAAEPTFATLQIGVNDYVQKVPRETFRANLRKLLDHMQTKLLQTDHLLIVTIPDYSVTRRGGDFGPRAAAAAGIQAFNQVLKEEAARRHLLVVDLYSLSRRMGSDPGAQAADGLHPSADEYARWARAIYPSARHILRPLPTTGEKKFNEPISVED